MNTYQHRSYIEVLREHGIRPLNHRVAVYEYLAQHPVHPTADEIYTDLKKNMASISRTTVYNVLHLLAQKNVITPITIDPKELRFDANTTPHVHFLCESCHRVYDLEDVNSDAVLSVPDGFKVNSVALYASGTCPACSS